MLERKVMIIDDNERTENDYIPAFKKNVEDLKNEKDKWRLYNFDFIYKSSMKKARDYLECSTNVVDVLVVDYDFGVNSDSGSEEKFQNGTDFVKYIRENINKRCQIIFYTMQNIESIEVNEYINLINSDVFKMLDKSADIELLGEAIFEAATTRDPIVESLERFYLKYQTVLDLYGYEINGDKYSFEAIIKHIRMDDEIGRVFIEKLLNKAILIDINIGA